MPVINWYRYRRVFLLSPYGGPVVDLHVGVSKVADTSHGSKVLNSMFSYCMCSKILQLKIFGNTYVIERSVFLHEENDVFNVFERPRLHGDGRGHQRKTKRRVPHLDRRSSMNILIKWRVYASGLGSIIGQKLAGFSDHL